MDNDDFRARLREWLPENHSGLLGQIPAESELYRIVDVPASKYSTGSGYVSTDP